MPAKNTAPDKTPRRFFRRADLILIVVLLLIAAALLLPRYIHSSDKDIMADIIQDGKVIQTVDLTTVDHTYTISLDCSPAAVITVEPGCIYYSKADCHDKICVRTGKLTKAGDTAACIPSKTLIRLRSGSRDDNGTDVLTY